MTPILIDTNVLVYAHDPGDPAKQSRAIAVLDDLHASGIGRLSVQCLAEFFAVVTRGASPLMTLTETGRQVELLARAWPVYPLMPIVVLEATRGVREHQLPYWDAQIWATARLNQVPVVFSEDFGDGRHLEGVTFVNPLAAGFDLATWL